MQFDDRILVHRAKDQRRIDGAGAHSQFFKKVMPQRLLEHPFVQGRQ